MCATAAAIALASAQGVSQQAVPLRDGILTKWTTDQGLPQNFVSSIAQTPDGFLWVGTLTGLVRFDGASFRGFSKDGPAEMQDDIPGLVPDGGDGLWIHAVSGLFHYRNSRFAQLPLAGNLRYRIEAMGPARDGGIWLYAAGKLARTRGEVLEVLQYPANVRPARSVAETRDGTLWIADGEGIAAMRANTIEAYRYSLPEAQLLYIDRFGMLYAGDGHHLFRFNGHDFEQVQNPGLTNFVSVMVDREHRLWMASGGLHGVSRKSGETVELLTAGDGLASNDARTVFEDARGDIWIGSISGLQRLHRGLFTTYALPASADGRHPQSDAIFEQKNGALWAGTVEDGAYRLLNGRWKRFGAAQGLPQGQIRGFFEDGAMPAVAISDYGVFAWNGKRYEKLPSIPHGYISTPATAGDGSVWFSVLHQGVVVLRQRRVQLIGPQQGLSADRLWSLAIDPSGTPWVGTASALQRWDGSQFQTIYTSAAPVLSMTWLRGGMAIGSMHGLILRSDTGHAHILTQDDGLPGNAILAVLQDCEENLWIATTRSIARVPRRQWKDAMEGRAARLDPAIYTQADGLKNSNVLPLNIVTALRANDGRIWFATANGLSAVDPRVPAEPPAHAVMDAVTMDDTQLPVIDASVPPGRHRITFRYTAPGGVAAVQTRFRYRLGGWDKDWIDAGAAREVSYTALPPGKYTFEVSAVNREGAGDRQPAIIRLTLRPHFWQTTWFLSLAALCAAALIIEITRRRTRLLAERLSLRFQERVAERERIAYQIHDTVIQDLIGATLKLELVGFQIADHPKDAERSVGELAGKMRETIARSRQMVSSLHSTAVPQYDLVDVLRHAEAEFRLDELPVFQLTSEGKPRPVHPLVRDEVYRICREALANAFRHSGASSVIVCVRFLPSILEVEIADDGRGMNEETRLHGRAGHFGLRGMQAHAERIGATLEIASSLRGTTVTLRMKTGRLERWQRWRRNGIAKEQEVIGGGSE